MAGVRSFFRSALSGAAALSFFSLAGPAGATVPPFGPGPVVPSENSEFGEAIDACQDYGLQSIQTDDRALGAERLILGPDRANGRGLPDLNGQVLQGNAMLSVAGGWRKLTFRCQLSGDFSTVERFSYTLVDGAIPFGSRGTGNGKNASSALERATAECSGYGLKVAREQDPKLYPDRLELGPTREKPGAIASLRGSMLAGRGMIHGVHGWQDLRFQCQLSENLNYVRQFRYRLAEGGPSPQPGPWGSSSNGSGGPEFTYNTALDTCRQKGLETARQQWWGETASQMVLGEMQSRRAPPRLDGHHMTGFGMVEMENGGWRDFEFACTLDPSFKHAYGFTMTLTP